MQVLLQIPLLPAPQPGLGLSPTTTGGSPCNKGNQNTPVYNYCTTNMQQTYTISENMQYKSNTVPEVHTARMCIYVCTHVYICAYNTNDHTRYTGTYKKGIILWFGEDHINSGEMCYYMCPYCTFTNRVGGVQGILKSQIYPITHKLSKQHVLLYKCNYNGITHWSMKFLFIWNFSKL